MTNNPAEQLIEIVKYFPENETTRAFLTRIQDGLLSRHENPESHFCVYFAAHDPTTKELFIGHHKKSNLWIFNGGHLDKGESPKNSVAREMKEEWGIVEGVDNPSLLTITSPNNPGHPCRQHFDVWYFISVNRHSFHPDPAKLSSEFYKTRFATPNEARHSITDYNTLRAINLIEASWSPK